MEGNLISQALPVHFFQYSIDLHRIDAQPFASLGKRLNNSKYGLPNLASLSGENTFAEVFLGWCVEGIGIHAIIHEPFRKIAFPEITRGDSLELFFDTRDVKTSGFNTRYCHHFFCLPQKMEGVQAGEKTHFRTEDAHEWCNAEELQVKEVLHPQSYSLTLFIPSDCLVGFEPESFDRLGFTYRINRAFGRPQHFSASSDEFQIEQQPSLWSSCRLVP